MSLSITPECLLCHFTRYMKKAKPLGDDATGMAFGRDLMRMYLNAPEGVSSPWFSPQVAELFKKYYNLGDNQYEEEKRQANAFAMARLEQMRAMIKQFSGPGAAKKMKRMEAIVLSMTPAERANYKLLIPSRRRRIAKGSGTNIADVNRLMKQYEQMNKMIKQFSGMGKKGKKRMKMPFNF